jgi:alkylation response protein AidB-like acyl-CoA dehydrogenase
LRRRSRRSNRAYSDALLGEVFLEFRLSEEQEFFRREVVKFVDAEVVPVADELDAKGEFPLALFRRLGELGYFGLRYPEQYGGAGTDMVTYCLWAEELARGSMSVAAAACMQSLMGTHFVFKYGTEEQRQAYLVPALKGEKIGTFALTEPNAGSDVGNITTFAEKKRDVYILKGTKTWVTNAEGSLGVPAKPRAGVLSERGGQVRRRRGCPGGR